MNCMTGTRTVMCAVRMAAGRIVQENEGQDDQQHAKGRRNTKGPAPGSKDAGYLTADNEAERTAHGSSTMDVLEKTLRACLRE